jgi:hypothetical protein
MTTKTYAITPEQLAGVATKLQGHGFRFDPTQPSGESEAQGFHVQWKLEPYRATITLVKHPMLMERIFWNEVDGVLGQPIG